MRIDAILYQSQRLELVDVQAARASVSLFAGILEGSKLPLQGAFAGSFDLPFFVPFFQECKRA